MHDDAVEFHEAAGIDYDEAFEWYLERSPDAALRFATAVDDALAEIRRAPYRWAEGPFETRRFLLRRFPFMLIYRERASGRIQILAVTHTSRKPRYWKDRI